MLIKFTVSNWESIKEEATLSMVASRERQHDERLSVLDDYGICLLPIAAIYGANASGKTKLCNAMKFAKNFVTKVTQPGSAIPRKYFMLDKHSEEASTKFSFQISVDNSVYEFSFAITSQKVVEEKLVKLTPYSEKILYTRNSKGSISFPSAPSSKPDQRLAFIAEGTRDNQLFLTKTIDQKRDDYLPIYNWFKESLVVIGTEFIPSSWGQLIHKKNITTYSLINNLLSKLDTGITHLDGIDIDFESMQFSEEIKARLAETVSEGADLLLSRNLVISKQNGNLSAKKLVAYHSTAEGKQVPFELHQESEGTLRMIELLPAIIDLSQANSNKTYVIDEFDHSMHSILVRTLLEYYLNTCSAKRRSQLIFTTHNLMLMDQDLFRRDELWVTERSKSASTRLISLGEYKDIRNDKDIRKSYLKGSFGGIPNIDINTL